MKTLRTPEECFSSLPDFPFEPHYEEVGDGEGGELGSITCAKVIRRHPSSSSCTGSLRGRSSTAR